MEKVKVVSGQSLADIAVQECGGIASLVDLAIANNISVSDDLETGTELLINSLSNAGVKKYYKGRNIKPATTLTEKVQAEVQPQGIGYWTIGLDFIVAESYKIK